MVMLPLIPLLPFAGFLVNAVVGRRLTKTASGAVACLAVGGSFVVSAVAAWTLVSGPATALEYTAFTWFSSHTLQVPFAFRLDQLSALMILVVTGIGTLIHVYSVGYMHDEAPSEYARYFSYLNLFAAFMLVLVLGANFPVMFVGWEGVGLCSYLLIGFWFTKRSAADAGKKAFVVNRVGDFGFILGMLLVFATFGTLDFQEVAAGAAARAPEAAVGVLTMATLLLFVGAAGKSAQIPLHVWLPDAMEGPTPVSALIHAATMVTAGVYMIGRTAVLFEHAPITLAIVAAIGVMTALLAGTIGLVQHDIKRVLAYSTVSQLGLMFLAMGVGAYAAGIFHLYTHAFFKALLFLGSGAVIHALAGEQDLRNMGGLRRHLPITYWTFVVGALAIAGVPGLAGFFSKDEILFRTFIADGTPAHTLMWALALLTSLLTAVYMFRLVFLAFHGERRHEAPAPQHPEEEEPVAHRSPGLDAPAGYGTTGHATHAAPHEAPWSMAVPLVVLAVGSVLAGYVGVPHALGGANRIEHFLEPVFHAPASTAGEATAGGEAFATVQALAVQAPSAAPAAPAAHANARTELMLMALSSGVALAGIGIAAFFWLRRRDAAAAAAERFRALYELLLGKYYVDEAYDAIIVQPLKTLSRVVLWKGVDAGIIDGAVNGAGLTVAGGGESLRRTQTGSVRAYAMALVGGVVVIVGFYLFR
jgi:NADH-quinone oxidoreductase subunit L